MFLSTKTILKNLLKAKNSLIQLKTYLKLLDLDYASKEVKRILAKLKEESPTIRGIFSYLPKEGTSLPYHVYSKFQGPHWLLAILADVGYPPGDDDLQPSITLEMNWLLDKKRWKRKPMIEGRKRFCASQEGVGLFAALSLGFIDQRCHLLAERLIQFQWEDGGWNCDKKPKAKNSSYHESLWPLRALNKYYQIFKTERTRATIKKAIELFLKRELFKSLHTGEVIDSKWLLLSYPSYWHYNVLSALKVLAECNAINDKRCEAALTLLEEKRLPDGGFPKELRYCQTASPTKRYYSPADWQAVNKKKANPWVTIDALFVLKKAKKVTINY